MLTITAEPDSGMNLTLADLTTGPLAEPRALRGRNSPVPAKQGLYGIWCDRLPQIVPMDGCCTREPWRLVYIGISPGRPASTQTLRKRLAHHLGGNAEGSTLRRTFGVVLAETLVVELRRVGSGKRMTLTHAGEQALDAWMDEHVRVTWTVRNSPWEVEADLLRIVSCPLNLDDNGHHAFHPTLSALRKGAIARAKELPIAFEGNQSRKAS